MFCIVIWMPKQKSKVQTALKKLSVFNGFAKEENALSKVAYLAHSPDPLFFKITESNQNSSTGSLCPSLL